MRKFLLLIALVLASMTPLAAQNLGASAAYWLTGTRSGVPSQTCSATSYNGVFAADTSLNLYQCSNINVAATYQWNMLGSASGAAAWSCQPGLGDGLNAIPAGTYLTTTCRNETGSTVTLTAIRCVADSGSSTCNATNGSGTGLLTGAITGTSTYANGTQSGTTTIASGDYIKVTYVADGTSTQIGIDLAGSY